MEENRNLFWRLVEEEHEKARAYCFRLAGSSDDGDDLYQDSILKAFHGFFGLKEAGAFRTWLYRIINNAFRARFRNPWWERVMRNAIGLTDIDWSKDPSGTYDARRRLEYAFSALSTDDRIIVTMADLEGWKISELAKIMSKTEGFIKMRLVRARKKMRKKLGRIYQKNAGEFKEELLTYAVSRGSEETE